MFEVRVDPKDFFPSRYKSPLSFAISRAGKLLGEHTRGSHTDIMDMTSETRSFVLQNSDFKGPKWGISLQGNFVLAFCRLGCCGTSQ